ncbi:centrosomal protein of 72 kDa [Silurus asotus]|uniref:Centrosomal protein of 72 kDa n=1 Tax=Silurus asotus TaxID=30991 RepID=A0AAD5A8W1_SILAS|nr:centrosomal protein of 72 kDa [Silurus asotus]
MAATQCFSVTESWIRERLNLQHQCLADVRSLRLRGTFQTGKIGSLGISLKNFVRLKSLDLSYNALVSVEGILHLKSLENLNLYYNRISSLKDVLSLSNLQNLKELDLRLNPVVEKDPFYHLYLVQAITKLRRLDDRAVRDRERKAALMHFSSESGLESSQKSTLCTMEIRTRSNKNPRIASVNRMMMSKLILGEGNEETVLNHNLDRSRNILTLEAHTEESCKKESTRLQETRHDVELQPLKDVPRVTFVEPSVKRCSSSNITPFRIQAESFSTSHPSNKNASSQEDYKDYSERRLHPPRLTFQSSENVETKRCSKAPERFRKSCKGAYRKPMEMLLGLVDEYWSGETKDHDTKHFFMDAVRILCMMEQEVTNRESEMTALREQMRTLRDKIEIGKREHRSEMRRLSDRLKHAHGNIEHLEQELRSVLEENVSLQKQLIRLEQQLLSDKLREMPNTQR